MGCLFPQVAFDTGYKTANGKTEYFRMPYGSGDFVSVSLVRKYKPVSASAPLKRINGHTVIVDPVPQPCNNCVGCRLEKARQWKVRVCLEAKKYNPDDVHFITLTYDDQHLPINEYGQPFVKKSQYQLKKEKLHCIKYLIDANNHRWERVRNKTASQTDIDCLRTAADLIKDIWEIVKDEK